MKEQPAQPQQEPVAAAMRTVIEAMQVDPEYAWSWHCNIAMAFVDAGGDHYTGNQGAALFIKMLANVEPAHELPSPPARKPLTNLEGLKLACKHHWLTIINGQRVGGLAGLEAARGIKGDA